MTNPPARTELSYVVGTEAWYRRPDERPYVSVCGQPADGPNWEFQITSYNLGSGPTLRLDMFAEAWRVFTDRPDLFAALAALSASAGPETMGRRSDPLRLVDVIVILSQLGATDVTPRRRTGAPSEESSDYDRGWEAAMLRVRAEGVTAAVGGPTS